MTQWTNELNEKKNQFNALPSTPMARVPIQNNSKNLYETHSKHAKRENRLIFMWTLKITCNHTFGYFVESFTF